MHIFKTKFKLLFIFLKENKDCFDTHIVIYTLSLSSFWGGHKVALSVIPQRFTQKHKLEEYTIDACKEDQKEALSYLLWYFKTWYESDKTHDSLRAFTPFRMTFSGVAGRVKSTLINTFVTIIRKVTQKASSVYVCGPTGSAAFNAGGEICHWLFNIQGRLINSELSAQVLKTYFAKLKGPVLLFVHERSMVTALLLGIMDNYCRQAAFKGINNDLS